MNYQKAPWELAGADCEVICHPGLLPLDWRTKARALLAYTHEVDRGAALESLPTAKVVHGVDCWAPPGEWYGGTYIAWADRGDAPDGWWPVGDHGECGTEYRECAGDDTLCLDLDAYHQAAISDCCAKAPPGVHLVTAGEGWPWYSRVIGPVTVVTL